MAMRSHSLEARYLDEWSSKTEREEDHATSASPLGKDMLDWILDTQGLWDKFRAPLELQDEMMKRLFLGIQPIKGRPTSSIGRETPSKSLASLILDSRTKKVEQSVPQNLHQLWKHYRNLGMVEPQRWRLCLGSQEMAHSPKIFGPTKEEATTGDILKCACPSNSTARKLQRDCNVCCERCEACQRPRKMMIPFDYIPFTKQLKLLCRSKTSCHDFLTMWRERHTWIGQSCKEETASIKDFWHGQKVKDYQAFWNPDTFWELPVICPNDKCKLMYRAFPSNLRSSQLTQGWNEEQQQYLFCCSKCKSLVQGKKRLVKGDPRNFALLCHWDGFQGATTKQKDVGIVEVAICNASKGSEIGPLPLLFIPFSLVNLEQKHGDLLQLFLTPLKEELISSFVNGFSLHYNYPSSLISDGLHDTLENFCTLRAILMAWTGDHPAQCKVGMLKDGGKNGCRRDIPKMSKVASKGKIPFYVYTCSREQTRYPPPKRQAEDMYLAISLSKQESTKKGREEKLSEAGLSGESFLWRLYELYGFDISRDLVYDIMHIFPLNLFKKYTKVLMESSSNQTKRHIDATVKEATSAIPKSLRHQGRWPSMSTSKHHTMFTAEEHQKFIMWCLPHILNTVTDIPKFLKDVGLLLIDLCHIFYNYTRQRGWTTKDMEVCKILLASWRVLIEENMGANSSILEHVAGGAEMLDDIMRHGSHDVIWCYKYERNVLGYVSIPTNNKDNEITYTQYQSRVLLSKVMQYIKLEEDGMLPNNRILSMFHACLQKPEGKILGTCCEQWHEQSILVATSEKTAKYLFKLQELLEPCPCKGVLETKGIIVSPRRKRTRLMSKGENFFLQLYWGEVQIYKGLVVFAKVFLKGQRYSVNDNVIVYLNSKNSQKIALCKIKEFFYHEHGGNIQIFFTAEFANNGFEIDTLPTDFVTGMKVISATQLGSISLKIMPMSHIMHKCFFLPSGCDGDKIIYEMQDTQVRQRLLQPPLPGCIPPWLEVDDVVLIRLPECEPDFLIGVVRAIQLVRSTDEDLLEIRKVRLGILCPNPSTNEWFVLAEEEKWRNWSVCIKVLDGWTTTAIATIEGRTRGICFKPLYL